jgi:CheY-like chemotaxis protein
MDRCSRREPPPVTGERQHSTVTMNHKTVVARTEANASSLPPTVVLIADADAETRTLYRDAFARAGYNVVEATDGRDALAKALPSPPSLVITELTLPFVNGYALCEILRRDPLTAGVPILVVTAAHPAERVERSGVDALLFKPTAPDSIVREARRLLATPRAVRAHSSSAQAQSTAHQQQSADLLAPSTKQRGIVYAKTHQRFTTTSPPMSPPVLSCPSCDRALKYEQSHVGGVSDRHPEQWDYFVCLTGCGVFQYRQRTRRVRRME